MWGKRKMGRERKVRGRDELDGGVQDGRGCRHGWATRETVPSLLLLQQGWNITVDLVIGPKGIRQLTSQDTKVESGQE